MPTVKQLQAELKKRGLETKGKKAELEARLISQQQAAGTRPGHWIPRPLTSPGGPKGIVSGENSIWVQTAAFCIDQLVYF